MKIQNAFRFGLFGGLGVLVALVIGGAITSLATIITYIGAALFIALGLDPLVSWLEERKWPRWAAILTVLVGVLGLFTGLVFAIIPVIVEQSSRLVARISDYVRSLDSLDDFFDNVQSFIPVEVVDVRLAAESALEWITNPDNLTQVGGGVRSASASPRACSALSSSSS